MSYDHVDQAKARTFYGLLMRLADENGEFQLGAEEIQALGRRVGWTAREVDRYIEHLRSRYLLELFLRDDPDGGPFDVAVYRLKHRLAKPVMEQIAVGRQALTPEDRALAWDRSGGRCWYCGKQTNPFRDFHVDHVVPVASGGTNELPNLVPCCAECNERKGAQSLEIFRARTELALGIADHRFYFERMRLR